MTLLNRFSLNISDAKLRKDYIDYHRRKILFTLIILEMFRLAKVLFAFIVAIKNSTYNKNLNTHIYFGWLIFAVQLLLPVL